MPTSRVVQCPSCGFQLQAGDMNLETMAARCRVCQALIDLRPDASPAPAAAASPIEPLPVPLPERIAVSNTGGKLVIERRWFSWMVIALIFFCAVWFGFLGFWYLIAFTTGSLVLKLVPLLHVSVGLFILYTTIATLVNRTRITVGNGVLTVRHGPLPWPGRRNLATGTLEQLYCEEHVSRSRNGTSVTYSVRARGKDGKLVKLATDLPERDQALYIEQQIERHLGIVNRPVSSEVRR